MINMMKSIDFLSEKPELYINGNTRFQTASGGILSVMTCLLIVAAALNFTVELLSYKNSSIIYNQIPSEEVNLDLSKFPFIIMLQDQSFKPIEDEERLYEASVNMWYAYPDDSTGITTMATYYEDVEIERCDLNKHFGEYRPIFEKVPFLEHHYCPKMGANNITLYGVYGSIQPYSYMEAWISRCDNSTRLSKRRKCFEKSEIDSKLETVYVSFKFLDYSIDHQNTENPGRVFLRSESLPVSSTIYKRNMYRYKNVNYTLDKGLIFEEPKTIQFFQVSSPRETVDLRQEGVIKGSFAQLTVTMDNVFDAYFRSFQKAQQTLANVGGLTKGLLVIAMCINYVLAKELYFVELIKAIFSEFYTHDYKDVKRNKDNNHFLTKMSKLFSSKLNSKKSVLQGKEIKSIFDNILKDKAKKDKDDSAINFSMSKTIVKFKEDDVGSAQINNFVKEEKEKDQVKTISNKVPAVKTASIKKRQNIGQRKFARKITDVSDVITLKYIERLLPVYCFKKQSRIKKVNNYLMVKDYITGQICIKNIISKLNEFEKLKNVTLSASQLSIFENIDNPPFNLINNVKKDKIESVWKDVIRTESNSAHKPFEEIYNNLKDKEEKSEIDNNIINLIEQVINIGTA